MLPLLSLRSFCSVQVVHRVYFDKTTAKADTLVASLCATPSMKLELNLLHFPQFLSSVKCEGTKDNIDVVTHCMMDPFETSLLNGRASWCHQHHANEFLISDISLPKECLLSLSLLLYLFLKQTPILLSNQRISGWLVISLVKTLY